MKAAEGQRHAAFWLRLEGASQEDVRFALGVTRARARALSAAADRQLVAFARRLTGRRAENGGFLSRG